MEEFACGEARLQPPFKLFNTNLLSSFTDFQIFTETEEKDVKHFAAFRQG